MRPFLNDRHQKNVDIIIKFLEQLRSRSRDTSMNIQQEGYRAYFALLDLWKPKDTDTYKNNVSEYTVHYFCTSKTWSV